MDPIMQSSHLVPYFSRRGKQLRCGWTKQIHLRRAAVTEKRERAKRSRRIKRTEKPVRRSNISLLGMRGGGKGKSIHKNITEKGNVANGGIIEASDVAG